MVTVVLVFLPILIIYELYTFIQLKIKENKKTFFYKNKSWSLFFILTLIFLSVAHSCFFLAFLCFFCFLTV